MQYSHTCAHQLFTVKKILVRLISPRKQAVKLELAQFALVNVCPG